MVARKLDGKATAAEIRADLTTRVARLAEQGIVPGLGTVPVCHTGTKDLAAHTRGADIVVMAAGRPGLLTADMVRPGAAVVDVGITRTEAGLVGDVAPDVAEVAGWVAPVPGGVGPMTRA